MTPRKNKLSVWSGAVLAPWALAQDKEGEAAALRSIWPEIQAPPRGRRAGWRQAESARHGTASALACISPLMRAWAKVRGRPSAAPDANRELVDFLHSTANLLASHSEASRSSQDGCAF